MPASIRDVAARAGVGVGTVSRVLNDSPSVSRATRDRVETAIAELEYRPNLSARALSTGRTHTVGAIVPFFTHPSAVERLRGVVDGLGAGGYEVALFNVGTAEHRARRFGELGAADRADGLIIVSMLPTDDEVEHFRRAGVPVVLIDTEHPRLSRVVTDDVAGGRMATEHLLELGHERIAFLGDSPDPAGRFMASARRLAGYRAALAAAGRGPREGYVRIGPHGRAEAHDAAHALMALSVPPTAVFVASDTQALGVVEAVRATGRLVPADVSVVGFDDLEIAELIDLTTVRQPLYKSGVHGAELLLRELTAPGSEPVELVLELELVVRETTAPLGAAAR